MMTHDPGISAEPMDEGDWLRRVDAWVARAEGLEVAERGDRFVIVTPEGDCPVPSYTTSEALARPIIEREGIEFEPFTGDPDGRDRVLAWAERPDAKLQPSVGATESEAGMYCYVGLKFGNAPFDGVSPATR